LDIELRASGFSQADEIEEEEVVEETKEILEKRKKGK